MHAWKPAAIAVAVMLSLAGVPALTDAREGAAAVATVDYIRPVRGPILRHFEPPASAYGAGHRGIDIGAAQGTTVVAAADGVVAFAGTVAGSLYVSIDHADGIRTTYSYLSGVTCVAGHRVAQGDLIGRTGTGHPGATDSHMHFGARRGTEYVDPEPLLLAGMRRDLSRVVRLAPEGAEGAGARGGG